MSLPRATLYYRLILSKQAPARRRWRDSFGAPEGRRQPAGNAGQIIQRFYARRCLLAD